jgi:hypothetical protein
MRVKSHWFKSDQPKPPGQVASAAAFIVWRVAQNVLKRMRAARFDIDPGPQYFAFLREFLIFLVAIADRIAYARQDQGFRVEFTTALANRVGEILEDNENDLLGVEASSGSKRRFIALLNERSADYAAFGYGSDGPDFGFLCYLGNRVTEVMPEKDQAWTVSQVMEIGAPDAVATVQNAMRDLFAVGPRPDSARRAGMRGD